MNKSYKYRLLPTKSQSELLLNHMFSAHQTYNILLSLKEKEKINNKLRKEKELEPEYYSNVNLDSIVKDVLKMRKLHFNTMVVQQERVRFIQNYMASVKKWKNGNDVGFLKYKKYSRTSHQSFQMTKKGYTVKDSNNPKYKVLKLFRQDIKIRWTRELPSEPKSITISFDGNDFWIVFNVVVSEKPITHKGSKKIGLDMNNKSIDVGNKKLYKSFDIKSIKDEYLLKKLKRLKRKQSKRIYNSKKNNTKLSNNFHKTSKKVRKLNKKITDRRDYRIHKMTNDIIEFVLNNKLNHIIVEDLNVKDMTVKTTNDNKIKLLGKNRTKSMKKNILDISYSRFFNILEYKCVQFGIKYSKVDPKNTSKTCSSCGKINNNLQLSDRQYECECGLNIPRDYNACINIQNRV